MNEQPVQTIPDLKPVTSSQIKAVGFEAPRLFIEFNSGAVYYYEPVPQATFDDMLKAPSIGSYFHKWVRNNSAYKTTLVRKPAGPPTPA